MTFVARIGLLVLLALPGSADESGLSMKAFMAGLSELQTDDLKRGSARLIELDPYLGVPQGIFELPEEPYVALSFKLSEAGHVSEVELISTNLDRARNVGFLRSCEASLKRSRFTSVEGDRKQSWRDDAIVILRFRDPMKP